MLEMEVLTDENISPAFKRIKYGIRGWLEDRTYEIKQELARVSIIYSQRAFQRLMVGSELGVRLVKYPHFHPTTLSENIPANSHALGVSLTPAG